MEGVGDGVGHAFGSHPALGEGEAEVELGRDHLGDEGAADQRANRGFDAMPSQPARQVARKGQQAGWPHEQRIEIEPQIAMMARFEDEMPAPHGQEFEKLLFHGTGNPGMLSACPSNYTLLTSSPA